MFESEFMKSMNCNYERIKLAEKPEEKRYQYCIVGRGGIKGLLPCSLRYINGDAYLYYDISSKQRLSQLFHKRTIDREWIKEFVWNIKRIHQEVGRFLLDESNIIWYPEQIYQDLEDNRLSFLYYPYYEGDNGFKQLLEFIVEKMDYKDEALVDCVYKMYEQYDSFGNDYLIEKIHQDVLSLSQIEESESANTRDVENDNISGSSMLEKKQDQMLDDAALDTKEGKIEERIIEKKESNEKPATKKGLLSFLEGARKKDKDIRESYKSYAEKEIFRSESAMVAEEHDFYEVEKKDEDYGRTVYIENIAEKTDVTSRLYDKEDRVVATLGEEPLVIGKKKDEADIVIDNSTISRIHAKITYVEGDYYLEDLNSTNGSFKNGLRLKPYEKRKMISGDEIRLGSVTLMFR